MVTLLILAMKACGVRAVFGNNNDIFQQVGKFLGIILIGGAYFKFNISMIEESNKQSLENLICHIE